MSMLDWAKNEIEIAAKAERFDVDTVKNEITLNFVGAKQEVFKLIVNHNVPIGKTEDNRSIVVSQINYDFSQEVDENGNPLSSICKIKYEIA